MVGEVSIDTNAAIALLTAEAVLVARLSGATITISTTAVGELYFGAFNSIRVAENVARVDQFVAGLKVVRLDIDTANLFGLTKAKLKSIGRMIPENDIWIAASALQHGMALVTKDQHFQNIADLQTIGW